MAKGTSAVAERNGAYPAEPGEFAARANGGLVVVRCTLTGVSPLLCNAMGEEQLLGLYTKEKAAKTASRPKPRELADSKVYRLKSGAPCVPPRNLYAAFINSGKFVRLDGKRQISTATGTILTGMMMLAPGDLAIVVPGTETAAAWEVDIQQGRNPNGGEAVCIIRPRFDEWEVRCELEIDQEVMPLKMARELVDLAGRRCGLGDFRPEKKGTFGRFVVTAWGLVGE